MFYICHSCQWTRIFYGDLGVIRIQIPRPDSYPTHDPFSQVFAFTCLNGICEDVHKHLVEFARVAFNISVCIKLFFYRYVIGRIVSSAI
jgi:hypothetical protein